MTAREISFAAGIGLEAVYNLIHEGRLGTIRVGKFAYVPRKEYERWLAQLDPPDNK